jgi:hypothetical protein
MMTQTEKGGEIRRSMIQSTFVMVIFAVSTIFASCAYEQEASSVDVARKYVEPDYPERCTVQLYEGGLYFFGLGDIGFVTFRCERGETCALTDEDAHPRSRGGDHNAHIPFGENFNGASPRTPSGDWISVDPCEFSGGAWLEDNGHGGYIAFDLLPEEEPEPDPEPEPEPEPGEATCEVHLVGGGLWFSGLEGLDHATLRCERGEVCELTDVSAHISPEGDGYFVAVPGGNYNSVSPRSVSNDWLSVDSCSFHGGAWLQNDGFGGYVAFDYVPDPEPEPEPEPGEADCRVTLDYYWELPREIFHLTVCSMTDNLESVVLRCERGRICDLHEYFARPHDGSGWGFESGFEGGVCIIAYLDISIYNGVSVISSAGEWLDLSRCIYYNPTWWEETEPGGYIAFDRDPGGYYSAPGHS